MDRRAVILTAAPLIGLGLIFLARREEVAPVISEKLGETIPENWRTSLDEQIKATAARIDEARDSLEETARLAGIRASGAIDATLSSAKHLAITSAIASLWMSLATALLIFVFAPERHQREKLWNTVKPALDVLGSAATGLWNLSGQLIGSLSQQTRTAEAPGTSYPPESRYARGS